MLHIRSHLQTMLTRLSPRKQVVPCQHGIVPIDDIFGKGAHSLVAGLNVEGQHRGAVAAARAQVSGYAQAVECIDSISLCAPQSTRVAGATVKPCNLLAGC